MRRKHFLFWLLSFQTDPDVHPVVPKCITIWQANDVPDVIAQGLWTSYWLGCTSKFNPELMVILMVKQGKLMMNPGILLIGTSLVRILINRPFGDVIRQNKSTNQQRWPFGLFRQICSLPCRGWACNRHASPCLDRMMFFFADQGSDQKTCWSTFWKSQTHKSS